MLSTGMVRVACGTMSLTRRRSPVAGRSGRDVLDMAMRRVRRAWRRRGPIRRAATWVFVASSVATLVAIYLTSLET